MDIAHKYIKPERHFIDMINRNDTKTSKTVEHLAIGCPYDQRTGIIYVKYFNLFYISNYKFR